MTAGRKVVSESQDWQTPANYVKAIKDFFEGEIDLDPCSNGYSIVGARTEYRLPEIDGLRAGWNFRRIYVNPPYGADRMRGTRITHWIEKCAHANEKYGAEVLALVPVATNTMHWKRHIWPVARAVCFLYDTRLKFLVNGKDGGKGAPMSCAMVYWGEHLGGFKNAFSSFGAVVDLGTKESRGYLNDAKLKSRQKSAGRRVPLSPPAQSPLFELT